MKWDIHVYNPRSQTTPTHVKDYPGTGSSMADAPAVVSRAARDFRKQQKYILAVPHRAQPSTGNGGRRDYAKKKSSARLDREIADVLAKEPGSGGPRVLKISPGKTFAGQRSITAEVQYPGEKPSRVEFVGPSARIGGAGPVVMVTRPSGHQTFVTDPSRFGDFGPEWVRRFFESA